MRLPRSEVDATTPKYLPYKEVRKFVCLTLFVGALAIFSFYAEAEDWRTLNEGEAPAKLSSLGFSDGSVLDANHPGAWGAWTVSIDPRNPAIVTKAGSTAVVGHPEMLYPSVTIERLMCRNSVVGERTCGMSLDAPPGFRGGVCSFFGKDVPLFHVECPTSIQLRQ